jgi:hypothetical protein
MGSVAVRGLIQLFKLPPKRLVATSLAFLLLVLSLVAASASLHRLVHADEPGHNHPCFLCLLKQGHIEVAPAAVTAFFCFVLLCFARPVCALWMGLADRLLSPNRGPPAPSLL